MRNITLIANLLLKTLGIATVFLFGYTAFGQVQTPFTPRFSEGVNGDFTIIANNTVSTTATGDYNGTQDNHDLTTVFVDIDSDPSTFNSSSANFTNPKPTITCLTIKKAYLYWAAADKEYDNSNGNGGTEPVWNSDEVKIMYPGSTTYNTITADETIFNGRAIHFVNDPYVCVKDITNEVQALTNPFGKFQIANVKGTEGRLEEHGAYGFTGTSGGWQIVFIYESPNLIRRNITLFDGYANVTDTDNGFNVDFNGFQTVPNGDVNANIVMGALEGDRSLQHDALELLDVSNSWTPLYTGERLSYNFFKSKITTNASAFTDRNPASLNTLGFDAATFPLQNSGNQLIGNNQTSATIRMTSNQETYGLYLLGLSVEVFEPNLGALNFTTSVVGSNFDPGDTAPVELKIKNVGNDDIVNLEMALTLPPQVEFLNTATLPTGVTHTYNTTTRELRFFVADGNTDINDPEYSIDFNLFVNNQCQTCSADIALQALATFNGAINTNAVGTLSSGTVDACGIGNHDPTYLKVTPVLSIHDASASEGSNLVFNIESSHLLAEDALLSLSYSNITASNGDYTSLNSFLVPTGTGNTSFSIPTLDDTIIEGTETFEIVAVSSSNITLLDNTAQGSIIDNDNAAPGDGVSFDNATVSVVEGNTAADNTQLSFIVNYTGTIPAGETVSVDYVTATGTADGSDFVEITTTTIQFTENNKTQTVLVDVIEDTNIENDEEFTVVLSNITTANGFVTGFVDGNTTNTKTGTIINDDNAAPGDGVSFDNATVSVVEGNTTADNTQLSFIVNYTGTIPAGETVSVDYVTATGTADGSDFVEITTTTIQFTENNKTQTVLVDVIEDTNIENDEEFTVVLSNITTANGFVTGFVDGNTTNTKTGTIINDDNAAPGDGVSFDNATVSVVEGNTTADNTQLSFIVNYTGTIPAGETVSVDYVTATGTADGSDFVEITTTTIQFTENNKTQTVLVDVIEDTNIENDEEFTVVLSNITTANGFVTGFVDGNTTNTKTGTIINDDNAAPGDGVSFDNATVSVVEGNTTADNTQLSFIVNYTGTIPAGETVSVDYVTATGTADGSDFVEITTTTIQFTENNKTQTVLVDVIEDTNIENDEEFTVVLSNITTANGFVTGFVDGNTTNTKTGTIINDDNAAPGDGVSFDNATVSVVEGNTTADNTQLSFIVNYTGTIPAGETVSVDYVTATGTADGSDFVEITTTTIQFTENNKTQTVLVDVIEDTNIENDEEFTVVLSNITTDNGFVTGFVDGNTTNTKTGAIINDDNAAPGDGVSFDNATVSVVEGNTTADNTQLSFIVNYTGTIPAGETVSVDYVTATGTADGSDFVEITTTTIQFTENNKTQTVLVDVIEDTNIENDEEFTVVLSNITTANGFVTGFVDGNTTNTKTGTIINDDNAAPGDGVSFDNATVSVVEGNTTADNTQLSFIVNYTGTIPAGETVSVDYVTATGTADGSDFVEITTTTIQFTENNKTQTVLVDVIEDTNIENDEEFTVVLSNITTANGFVTGFVDGNTTNTKTGTIINDDNAAPGDGVSFDNATVSVVEGNTTADNTQLSFIVNYTGTIPAGETVSVDYVTATGTADGSDFVEITTTTIQFTENNKTQTVLVDVIEDTNIENDEDFTVVLSNITTANGFVTGFVDGNATNTKTGTILNDDNAAPGDGVSFDNATVSVVEGNAAADNTQLSFIVNYTGTIPAGETVSVDYVTATGTADGSDFVEITTTTIQFTENNKTQTVLVDVIEDTNIENDEDFTVVLSNITTDNGFVTGFVDGNTTNTKTGTILNDDNAAPGDGVSFDNATVSVLEGNTAADNTQLSFIVNYTGAIPAGETVSVDYVTATGTADGSDFVEITTTTIQFTENNKTQTVLVDVIEDTNIENDEEFTVVLSNITTANGFVTGFVDGNTTNTKTGTIINDDNAAPGDGVSFDNATVSVVEGNTAADNTQLSFIVNYTGTIPAGETVSVDYVTATGTADGSDFVEITTTTIQFTENNKTQTVLVDVIEDTNIENDEDFTVVLSNITTANGFVTGFVDGNTTNTKTGTILNDDNAAPGDGVSFDNATVSVVEGNTTADNTQLSFIVNYTGTIPAGETVSVDYVTATGTADGSDFVEITTTTIQFTENNKTQTVLVDVIEDTNIENDEDFTVVLSNITTANGFVTGFVDGNTTNTKTGTIINDDNAAPGDGVSFDNATVSVVEGNTAADNTQLSFIVNYTGTIPAGETVSVDYVTATGTADGSDFVEITTTTIQFTENNKTQTVLVDVIEDTNIENDEDFTVVLSNITTANGFVTGFVDGNATNTKTGTILNDDGNADDGIAFTNPNVIVTEGADAFAVYTVTLTGTIDENVYVDYTTVDGTALNPDDITTTAGTITFTPTVNSFDIQVPITNDEVVEPTEDFTLVLSNIQSNIGIGFVDGNPTNTANGTINDDDLEDITVEPYQEQLTMECGDEIPEVPELVFNGGCGDFVVDFSETEQAASNTDDFMIVRTWKVTDSCGTTSSFVQLIFVMQTEKEFFSIDICVEDESIDLLEYLPSGFDNTGTFTVSDGASLDDTMFDPSNHKTGEYLVSYASENTSCKFYVDFTINVNNECVTCSILDMVVSKTITVNGDGINDIFEITGLESCGYTYQLMIFNRWGNKVYESNDYQNDWGGYAPNSSVGKSGILPTGTYYYMITILGSEIEPVNGYIYLGSN